MFPVIESDQMNFYTYLSVFREGNGIGHDSCSSGQHLQIQHILPLFLKSRGTAAIELYWMKFPLDLDVKVLHIERRVREHFVFHSLWSTVPKCVM